MLENARKCWNGRNEKLNAGKFFPDDSRGDRYNP